MDSRKNTLSTSVTPYMQSEDEGDDLFMTRDEVTEVVKQFRIDRLNEFLKAPDVVALTWLTHLSKVTWSSGAVPLDWENRVVFPDFRKGD